MVVNFGIEELTFNFMQPFATLDAYCFFLMLMCTHIDGEVPATMHDWKDTPGRNRCHFKVSNHQEYD